MDHVRKKYPDTQKLRLFKENFKHLKEVLDQAGVKRVSGVVFDLGVSSHQLRQEKRGFSFQEEGPLDMRMNQELKVTAADLVNALDEGELNELFIKYGEERYSRRIARAIVRSRRNQKIETTKELSNIIERTLPGKRGKLHPATRVFQALRIAVNDELGNLKEALPGACAALKKGGRLVVVSFHSLEDRIVKDFFANSDDLKVLTEKPIVPGGEEVTINPQSRSAKMRVAEKLS